MWATLRRYWADGSAGHRGVPRACLELDGLRAQYLFESAIPGWVDPDNRVIDKALISRPGVTRSSSIPGTVHWRIRARRSRHDNRRVQPETGRPRGANGRSHESAITGKATGTMTGRTPMATTYAELPNKLVSAANGVGYAYREGRRQRGAAGFAAALPRKSRQLGPGAHRRAGVRPVGGCTRSITPGWAALPGKRRTPWGRWRAMPSRSSPPWGWARWTSWGFSIGSFVAQEIALIRPVIVRRLGSASSAPEGAAGMHGWAPEVIGAVGRP